jgi:hypothetical protein
VVSTTGFETPPFEAVIVAVPELPIATVETVNVEKLAPTGTVMVLGTVARDVSELDSAIKAPPVGAGPFKVTVAVAPNPPITLVWFRLRLASSGRICRVVVLVVPRLTAVIVAVVLAVTDEVVTLKVAEVAPAVTVTLPGTTA